MTLRVATYNIHRCVGRDGMTSCQRIATVLKGLRADVMALQEVAYDPDTLGRGLGLLTRTLRATAIPGPTLMEHKGWYGNVILSRIPPCAVQRLDLSRSGREARGAVAVTIIKAERRIRIVATHLGLGPAERRAQTRRLLTWLAGGNADITILMGDCNEWWPWARVLRWFAGRFGRSPAPATFPAHRPLLSLDRIWVTPAHRLLTVEAYHKAPAGLASDHLPLVARVRL